MTANDWIAIIVGVLSVSATFVAAIRWIVKAYLHELVPNSGSSMKDKINRLETRVDEIYLLLIDRKSN
jgi:hypothetical protein